MVHLLRTVARQPPEMESAGQGWRVSSWIDMIRPPGAPRPQPHQLMRLIPTGPPSVIRPFWSAHVFFPAVEFFEMAVFHRFFRGPISGRAISRRANKFFREGNSWKQLLHRFDAGRWKLSAGSDPFEKYGRFCLRTQRENILIHGIDRKFEFLTA